MYSDLGECNGVHVIPQGGNELWLATALSHPALARLSGPSLGALLGALLSPEV
jgi:hypothetical protein